MVGKDCGGAARAGRNAAGVGAGFGFRALGFGKSGYRLHGREKRTARYRGWSRRNGAVVLKLAAGTGGMRFEWSSATLVRIVVSVLRSAGNVSRRAQSSLGI